MTDAALIARCDTFLDADDLELEVRCVTSATRFKAALQQLGAEVQQTQQLDISFSGVRVTLHGVDSIKAFCVGKAADEWMLGMAVMFKEQCKEHPPVLIAEGVKMTLKRERPYHDDVAAVVRQVLNPTITKHYRFKQRYSQQDGPLRLDMTAVKSSSGTTAAGLLTSQPAYEMEVEAVKGCCAEESAGSLARKLLLSMRQLGMLKEEHWAVGFRKLTGMDGVIGPKPVTLERHHLMPDSRLGAPSVLHGYTVTAKADGQRANLYVDAAGAAHLITAAGARLLCRNVAAKDTILDGEYVSHRDGQTAFLGFDCYFYEGKDVRDKALVPGRLQLLSKAVASVQAAQPGILVQAKKFVVGEGAAFLAEAAALWDAVSSEQPDAVDGLIFTPAGCGIPQGPARRAGAWHSALKWKPPQHTTADFWVPHGDASVVQAAAMSADVMLPADILVRTLNRQAKPTHPHQLIGVPYGRLTDPDGIVPAKGGRFLHDEAGAAGWVWAASRLRPDKKGLADANKLPTVQSILRSVRYPVSLEHFVGAQGVTAADLAPEHEDYYSITVGRADSPCAAMQSFHNCVKEEVVLRKAAALRSSISRKRKLSLLDLGCGQGGDLNKYLRVGFQRVLGVDKSPGNIRRLYSRLIELDLLPNSGTVMAFLCMDASQPLGPENAPMMACRSSPEDKWASNLQQLSELAWGRTSVGAVLDRAMHGMALQPFDVVACQFAVHYFCKDLETLGTFLDNLQQHLSKEAGVFVVTFLDGQKVQAALNEGGGIVRGTAADGLVLYELKGDVRPAEQLQLGVAIDAFVCTINRTIQEYLVPLDVLVGCLKARGIHLLQTGSFADLKNRSKDSMSAAEATFSDLHSYAIFQAGVVL
eukprot:jgi/Chrzof1/8013/UNPLg00064.t1